METIIHFDDTIAALATAFGEAAVGIVRLSGPRALAIVSEIFFDGKKQPLEERPSNTLHYGWVVKDKQRIAGCDRKAQEWQTCVVDEVLVVLMRSPKSYTREDVVEIQAHGGSQALRQILELVLSKGARLADPGEFTRRAFLNGRIDLSQAEAVLDIIQAKSSLALANGLSQLQGSLSRLIGDVRKDLLDVLSIFEAHIDFEEEMEEPKKKNAFLRLEAVQERLWELIERGAQGRVIREGVRVVLYGRPNTGKSSLLNALLRQERAIVTPIAGTTRDTIEEIVHYKGLALRLIDTAGVLGQEREDEVGRKAQERTQKALQEADLILFVLDSALPLSAEDQQLLIQVADKSTLLVLNKCDLGNLALSCQGVEEVLGKRALSVSSLTGDHIPALEEEMARIIFEDKLTVGEGFLVVNARHIETLKKSVQGVALGLDALGKGLSPEFAIMDLKRAYQLLGELTGEEFSDDILNAIFSKFCIGK